MSEGKENAAQQNTAQITGRAVITGELVLESPLLIGSGEGGDDRGGDQDIHVLKDRDGRAFIPGTSLCGVLRDFLRAHETDAAQNMKQGETRVVRQLFGLLSEGQSMISIDDVPLHGSGHGAQTGAAMPGIVVRDGVGIDGVTGVGVDGAKYDYEAVERGARGPLRILVTRRLCHEKDWPEIYNNLLLLLEKMQQGISLGAITAKGFGKVKAENVAAGFYDFHQKEDILSWLRQSDPKPEQASDRMARNSGKRLEVLDDCIVEAAFAFRTSVIIRDYNRKERNSTGKKDFNAVSLKSGNRYVLPGTTLKGVLRHHAEYLLQRMGLDDGFLENLMGYSKDKAKKKSRFMVDESLLDDDDTNPKNGSVHAAGQTRIRIDRLTGGVMDTALMDSKPLWQKGNGAAFRLRFIIRKAEARDVGLALFLLRDLWQGRVAIGGEKSVGRGTLQGLEGVVHYRGQTYHLGENGKVADEKLRKDLEGYAAALRNGAKKEATAK